MNHLRAGEDEKGETLSLSLSLLKPSKLRRRKKRGADAGVFECKTCNRRFPTFQALGGHRTSHMRRPGIGHVSAWRLKPSVHRCSVCNRTFALGQALGGHMRRHRMSAAVAVAAGALLRDDLDLNSDPSMEEGCSEEYRATRASSHHDLLLLELFK